jgi:hypothetical protein
MVTHASYYSEEDPTFHRCGRGGHSYPLAQERPENGHGPSRTYGDGRNGDHAQEQEQNTQVRRRVPVAVCLQLSFKPSFMISKDLLTSYQKCQRCRKRKIRCSGDPGNGGPCLHCKNANVDDCKYLRVIATQPLTCQPSLISTRRCPLSHLSSPRA